ncbi:MAG: tRNA pseudouridine(13) synthase TruD [Candidatus Altiarchaeales archaeon ex4484_2]|nr:MAG: tRNA pseudouridine(13) synthase TruD [Candidatus Altiarchaeales archaeon ex4484_2]
MDKSQPEREVGLEVYKSRTPGLGGKIKQLPKDFIVEEITPQGLILEAGKSFGLDLGRKGEQLHLTLEKKNRSTLRAIKELSNALRVSRKRIGFAGTKDKRALTTQRISVWNISTSDLGRVNLKDIHLKDYSYSDKRINLGDLQGNRFTLRVRGIDLPGKEIRERIDEINNELRAGFPNFFGIQRFGSTRPITHLVGREIVKGNLEAAVMVYLTDSFHGESDSVREARDSLGVSGDYRQAVREYPRHLEYEHSLINHLIRNEGDYGGALQQLPSGLKRMFVHAYQSFIFNRALSYYLREQIPVERLPLVGFKSGVDEVTASILEDEGVSVDDFRAGSLPELGSRGALRDAFVVYRDFEVLGVLGDDLSPGNLMVELRFVLSKGCYATSLLREFMKH